MLHLFVSEKLHATADERGVLKTVEKDEDILVNRPPLRTAISEGSKTILCCDYF
jgi:hypothetical protein